MQDRTDSPPKKIPPTLLLSAQEAMDEAKDEAKEIKREWDSHVDKIRSDIKHSHQLRRLKRIVLIIGILLSLIFLMSLPLTIIFPFTWMIILFLVSAASVCISFIGFGILHMQHQNTLDDRKNFRIPNAEDLKNKMIKTRSSYSNLL